MRDALCLDGEFIGCAAPCQTVFAKMREIAVLAIGCVLLALANDYERGMSKCEIDGVDRAIKRIRSVITVGLVFLHLNTRLLSTA